MSHADAFAIFAKVGELQSISGAARSLAVPKASVSRAIARLETTYGVALFDRTDRRMRLTEAGRTLHGHCVKIMEELFEVETQLAALRGVPTGILRVGCPADLARGWLAASIPRFLDQYPDIDLRLRVGDRLLPEPNVLDVVLHGGWLSDSNLVVRKFAVFPTILVASRQYVASHGIPSRPGDLAGHRTIGNFYLDPLASEAGKLPAHVPVLEIFHKKERFTVPIWRRFASNDQSVMYNFVKSGTAIAPLVASSVTKALEAGDFVHILPDWEIYNPPSGYAIFTGRSETNPKLRVFLEFINDAAKF